jgi:hypothetical protein
MANALRASCHPGLQRWLPNSSLSSAQLAACNSNMQAALQQQVRLGVNEWVQHMDVCILQQGFFKPLLKHTHCTSACAGD